MFENIEQLLNQGAGHLKSYTLKRYNEDNNENHWRLSFFDPIKEFDGKTCEEVLKMGENFLADKYLESKGL